MNVTMPDGAVIENVPDNISKSELAKKYFANDINAVASKYNLPPSLISSVISAESSWDINALSPKGASGLMQLMPDVAKQYGVKDVMNPSENIDAGARHLRSMMDRYNDNLELALAAYNAGPGNVDKYGGIPPFPETQDYVKKITGAIQQPQSQIVAQQQIPTLQPQEN